MRPLWHLAPCLVLFGALLALFPSNAEDVFTNETLKKSSLLQNEDELDALPFLDSQVFPARIPIRVSPVGTSLNTMDCNFRTKVCQWEGVNKWSWVKPSYSNMKKDSPAYDPYDTTYALQANFSVRLNTNSYSLKSPTFSVDHVSCFKFDYYFLVDSTRRNDLDVGLMDINRNNKSLIWSTTGLNIDDWGKAEAQIDQSGNYKIVINVDGYTGFIAVKNLRVVSGACPTNQCTFESGDCGYKTIDSASNNFKVTAGYYTAGTVKIDHTSHSPYGHVMYANIPSSGGSAALVSPAMSNLQTQCLTFFFLRGGSGVNLGLHKYHINTKKYDLLKVWQSNETHLVDEWIRVQQNLVITDPIYLVFYAQKKDTSSSKIEIDDISFKPFQCPAPITCTFNVEFCGWKEETKKSNLQWSLGNGRVMDPTKLKTQTPFQSYSGVLYTDFTQIQDQGSMELLSEFVDMPLLGGACVELTYNVKSISLDTDSFQLTQIDITGNRNVIWSFNDTTKMSSWIPLAAYIPKTVHSVPYRLSLSAKSANAGTYIAVKGFYYLTNANALEYCGHPVKVSTTTITTTTTVSPAKTLNCDFEKGNLCNWKSSSFRVESPATTRIKTMFFPTIDITSNSKYGKVAYAFSEERNSPTNSLLYADNPYPNMKICFGFYYYFYSNGPSSFAVTMDRKDQSVITQQVPIFRGFGANENVWRKAYMTIIPNDTYSTFSFRASLQSGILVLDNIYARQGDCYSYQIGNGDKICDFEQNQTCIFEPMVSFYPPWRVYKASSFGIYDHTTHSRDGHYYGLDLSVFGSRSSYKKHTSVLSRQMSGYTYRCVQFSYLLANVLPNTTLSYDIITGNGANQRMHWEVAGSTLKLWFTHKVKTPYRTFDFRMTIETLGEPSGKVFVDDIKFLTSSCTYPHNCGFEEGDVCNMGMVPLTSRRLSSTRSAYLAASKNGTAMTVLYLTDYADQIWHVFTPRQSASYIQHDNTERNFYGRYLLLTADDPSDRGIMITERYNLAENGGRICLSFAAFKASSRSVLEIYQGESFNETHGTKIWDLQRQTSDWETFEILAYPFQKSSVDIFFYIVGTLTDKDTYIGLDDVRLKTTCINPSNIIPTTLSPGMTTSTPNPNDPNFFICKNGKRIASSLTCNYVNDCTDGSDELSLVCGTCNFREHGLCRYTIKPGSFGDFNFHFRDTVSVGPRGGPNDNNNFLVASGHRGYAYLSSPIIHQSYLQCEFSFYYWFSSSERYNNYTSSSMRVYLEQVDTGRRVLFWESSFNLQPNSSWRSISLPIHRVAHSFRLTFYAYQSSSLPTKVHAIDRVYLSSCSPPSVYSGSCSSSYFQCSNRVCVPKTYRCDFEDDCGDGSDEKNCPVNSMTSFESGRGLWGKGIYKNWRVTQADQFTTLRNGPTYDHTTDFQSSGSYLYARAYAYDNENVSVIAEIDSPPFTITSSACKIHYFVYKNSRESTLLAVLQNIYTGKKYQLEEIGTYDYKWVRHFATLYSRDSSASSLDMYRVIFTATLNASSRSFSQPYVAIDDISFTPECIIHTGPVVLPTLPDHSEMTTPKPDNCPTISCISPKGTKVCLQSTQFCDFRQDCKDGSDELNCGDCRFEGTMCEWKSYLTRNLWTIIKPAYTSLSSLPKKDADGSSYGGYLSVKVVPLLGRVVALSRLQSPRINGRTALTCKLQFSYFSKFGGVISVRWYRAGMITSLFSTRAPATQWTSFQVDVGSNPAGFNLEFYGGSTYRYGYYEDLAIDNVKMVQCNPYIVYPTPPPSAGTLNCTFENGLCGWAVTGPTQRSNWLRTYSTSKEPGNDHTSMQYPKPARSGTWMTTQSSSGSLSPDKDYLVSTAKLKSGQTYCFSFWLYFMSIDRGSYFALFASKTGKASASPDTDLDYTPLWQTNVPISRNWNQKYVEISSQGADFYLIFIAAIDSTGIVGLDDTALVPGKCPIVSTTFCDFEINTCDWKLQSGGFQLNTNKFIDHTTGTTSGHFVQDTSTGNKAVMTKQMSTMPIFNNSNSNLGARSFCLQFYYYISTDFVNAAMEDSSSMLSVKVKQGSVISTRNITIVDTYNDGLLSSWSLFQFSFYSYKTGNIEIDGMQSKQYSQLLIDDISVTQRYCQTKGACDFEDDMCGWSNMQTVSGGKKVLWLRIQPNSRYIKGRLMQYDHTTKTKNGNYLVMPAMMQTKSYSVLRSPLLRQNMYPQVCFSMYYFAQGYSTRTVALTLRLIDLGTKKYVTKTINATSYLMWTKFEAEFSKLPNAYVFQIEGSYISGIYSDIGLDDIRITPGSCSTRNLPTTTTPVPPSEKKLDCTFDNGQCNWKYDTSSWKAGKFNDLHNNYAPRRDHTTQAASGSYLLFQPIPSSATQSTYIISSTINVTFDKDHCLTMWYFDDGEDPFSVQVDMIMPKYTVLANWFSSAIENRRRWNLFKADIQYNPAYTAQSIQLQIRYALSVNRLKQFSIFALDDIMVRPGKCQHLHDYVYTFTSGLEDLELEYIQPLVSVIGQIYTPAYTSQPGAPKTDHTSGTSKGSFFLFMNHYTLAPTVYMVTLSMTGIPPDRRSFDVNGGYTCVRFAYQVTGNATLKVFVAPNNAFTKFYRYSTPLWQSKYSKNTWTIGEINKRDFYEHKVVFYMEKTPDKTSFVALDDLTLLSHRCQAPIDCDFEDGRICSYSPLTDKTTSQFNWGLFTSPPQDSTWAGPVYDHTTKNYGGGYLYLTSFRNQDNFNNPIVAKVVSGPRSVSPSKSYCLSLWMQMTTDDLSLKLSIIRYGPYWTDANRTQTIASKAYTAVKAWTLISVPIDQTMLANTYEIQLIIEGTLATNSKGVIAVDDILLMEGACQQSNLICENGTPITRAQICNFVKDCPSGLDELNCGTSLCNFEKDTCGWGNMSTYNQKWLLTKASNRGNNQLAPAFDGDANRDGHYMMVSWSGSASSSNAEMALNFPTPMMYLKNSYQTCVMQFDYYIASPEKNTFNYNLAVRVGRDRTDWAVVYNIARAWSLNGWSKAYAHIGERANEFMADVLGHLDYSATSFMAVDNIQFVNCSMPKPLGPNAVCPSGQFMCKKNRFCISNDAICNYKNDCGDESDEIGCYRWTRCNFEYSFATCHIKTDDMEHKSSMGINVEWNIRRGRYSDLFDPKIDNTLRTGYGRFLALEKLPSYRSLKQTFTSEFYSPMMTSTNQNACRMRFFYFINGEPVTISQTYLNIYIRYASKRTVEPTSILLVKLNIQGDLQQRWNFATVQFTSPQPFQFVFRGHLGTNLSRLAIDDISFDPSGCLASSVNPLGPTTLPPVTAATGQTGVTGAPVTVTSSPNIHRQQPNKSNGGKVAAAIIVPLFVVLAVIGAFFAYTKYQKRPRGDEHITLSMKGIQEDTDY